MYKNRKRARFNYERITQRFSPGDIIIDHTGGRLVVLEVREREWRLNGINCEFPGLYGFYGFWYGENALDHRSYGKIQQLDERDRIIGTFNSLKNNNLTTEEFYQLINSVEM